MTLLTLTDRLRRTPIIVPPGILCAPAVPVESIIPPSMVQAISQDLNDFYRQGIEEVAAVVTKRGAFHLRPVIRELRGDERHVVQQYRELSSLNEDTVIRELRKKVFCGIYFDLASALKPELLGKLVEAAELPILRGITYVSSRVEPGLDRSTRIEKAAELLQRYTFPSNPGLYDYFLGGLLMTLLDRAPDKEASLELLSKGSQIFRAPPPQTNRFVRVRRQLIAKAVEVISGRVHLALEQSPINLLQMLTEIRACIVTQGGVAVGRHRLASMTGLGFEPGTQTDILDRFVDSSLSEKEFHRLLLVASKALLFVQRHFKVDMAKLRQYSTRERIRSSLWGQVNGFVHNQLLYAANVERTLRKLEQQPLDEFPIRSALSDAAELQARVIGNVLVTRTREGMIRKLPLTAYYSPTEEHRAFWAGWFSLKFEKEIHDCLEERRANGQGGDCSELNW